MIEASQDSLEGRMRIHDFLYLVQNPVLWRTPMVVTIGVYDGIHLGHLEILRTVVDTAQRHVAESWESMVITFDRNPKMLKGTRPTSRPLATRRQNEDFFTKIGIDHLVVIDFSDEFSRLSGEEFITLVCSICAVKAMVVGEDFRCGAPVSAAGPVQLQEYLSRLAPEARLIIPPFVYNHDGEVDSSSLVRENLQKGRLIAVSEMLGRDYEVDLAQYPSKITESSLLFRTGQFIQLLPPPGAYETYLWLSDGTELSSRTFIDDQFLTIVPEVSELGPARPDRLCFIKEL